MPLRCTRHAVRIAAIVALLAAPAAFAADSAGSVGSLRLGLTSVGASTLKRITIDGVASAGCLPTVGDVAVEGAEVAITLTAPMTGCKPQRRTPFRLQVDPANEMAAEKTPVYHVHVYLGSAMSAHLVAFSLLDTAMGPNPAPIPENGFWWTQPTPDGASNAGTGMSLELQDNRLAASLLGFGDTGAPSWYFGSATLGGRVARIPLVQLANGDGWFGASGAVSPSIEGGPRLDIEFLSPTHARAFLVRNEDDVVQVRPLMLSRSAFASGASGTPWIGRWVFVPEEGGGARVFDFATPSNRDADSFRLVDSANDAVLDCRLVSGTQQADACTLSSGASTLADFDQVGLDRFAGRGANGSPVQLIRVPK
jgi:type 1 fimbria pilin